MRTENLSTLKINKLTQAQYDRELEAGRIDPNALYLTPDSDDAVPVLQANDTADDRTSEILSMLNKYGVCRLGKGDFYISNLDMPTNTTLEGCGMHSKIYLNPSVNEGYAIKIGPHGTIQDLMLLGNATSAPTEVGNVHGIVMQGDASGANNFDVYFMPTITNCHITGFTGGGIRCDDTGTSLLHGLNVTNCKIYNCGAGIYTQNSEYHRFTNVACLSNLYGCINNGGNNVFVNCMFNSNTIGFSMTGSSWSTSCPNDSHGSAIGCTFNHNGGNNGPAVQIRGTNNGYIFQGCQVFFGSIDINNGKGIVFDGMNFGRSQKINIRAGSSVQFTNGAFAEMPTFSITENDNVEIHDCYTWSGEVVGDGDHPDSGVTAGTYNSVTVNAKGHVIAGSNPTTLSGYGITDAATKTELNAIKVPITATSTDGVTYTATAPHITATSITELKGAKLVIIPNMTSTNAYNVALNVNGLGAQLIKRWDNTDTSEFWSFTKPGWFKEGYPITITFNGKYWIIEGMNKPYASDLSGTVSIGNGGTGATTAAAARTNLGLNTETWTFTLEDGSTVTKAVYLG